jgi:hypothetical protein
MLNNRIDFIVFASAARWDSTFDENAPRRLTAARHCTRPGHDLEEHSAKGFPVIGAGIPTPDRIRAKKSGRTLLGSAA